MTEESRNLDLLMNVSLALRAELGRCAMRVSDVLKLGKGSVVALDRPAGTPIDLFVNDRLVARGEVVAVEDRYGVRVTEVIARKMRRT